MFFGLVSLTKMIFLATWSKWHLIKMDIYSLKKHGCNKMEHVIKITCCQMRYAIIYLGKKNLHK
jgi:hypothetical protein